MRYPRVDRHKKRYRSKKHKSITVTNYQCRNYYANNVYAKKRVKRTAIIATKGEKLEDNLIVLTATRDLALQHYSTVHILSG